MNHLQLFKSKDKYNKIIKNISEIENANFEIVNSAKNVTRSLACALFECKKENIIYCCDDIFSASLAFETISDILGADNVSFFPVEEFISSDLIASSYNYRLARMMTQHLILSKKPQVIVTCSDGLTRQSISSKRMEQSILHIEVGKIIDLTDLTIELVDRGYKKVNICEEMGTFSVRGSIIDIYPLNEDTVCRIYFFDNEIEKIKKVNISNQMSTGNLDSFYIYPLFDLFYESDEIDNIEKQIRDKFGYNQRIDKDIEKIKDYSSLDQLYIYLPCIDKDYTSFVDLVNPRYIFYENIDKILSYKNNAIKETINYFDAIGLNVEKNFFLNIDDIISKNYTNILCSSIIPNLHEIKLDKLIDIKTSDCFEYNNNMKAVIEDIKASLQKTYTLTAKDDIKLNFIKEIFNHNQVPFNENSIKDGMLNLIQSDNAYGFVDYELNYEIISPNEYAPGRINRYSKYQKYYKHSTKIYSKDDISAGDYVVHQDYGIGQYVGIVSKELHGIKNDYLLIRYMKDEKLFVPVENIYLIEKYSGSGETIPKLNSVSGKEWQKKKAQVREKVLDVAKEIIKIQAERELRKGYIYSKDTPEQADFEKDFEFEETPDQLQAIADVKKDMESTRPVDRLICGDVGYGKTEIAMRAAFKAVMDGKQVAYLAPTTVLTRQHYYSFRERFEKYGVRVELINRFVPAKKQKEIIEGLKQGYVDIVVGTHRILSSDIKFRDLGLLIIDEEQRFGVMHKEKIKSLKANIDVITLTATPIPRTLQMALSGLKDFSLIETPPENRLPIQTYVLEENESVIRDAINREMGRGGQVFYLLNRVEKLEQTVDKIKKLVPSAKIGMIHGKMDKTDIENELVKFLDNIYNVLVCTTIIETGIDIPNANTLIIERADILGLSQLYQIRGRVGRSDRIAYAYLTYKPDKTITSTALKRLNAIKEFTSLGSGYKIAMRDLAIRGAGNILGEEQSGFIDAVGMDLYSKLLSEAINEMKGIVKEEDSKPFYNISISKHIDEKYIYEDELRLEMHKQINKISSRKQIELLTEEFTDRYGTVPDSIKLYMQEKYLEFLLKSKGVQSFKESDKEVKFHFDEISTSKMNFKKVNQIRLAVGVEYYFDLIKNELFVTIEKDHYPEGYIYKLSNFLERL